MSPVGDAPVTQKPLGYENLVRDEALRLPKGMRQRNAQSDGHAVHTKRGRAHHPDPATSGSTLGRRGFITFTYINPEVYTEQLKQFVMFLPSSSASAPSLVFLPLELLDYLASFIPDPSDLLSLAITNSTFRDIVIPFHLHYRTVRCTVEDSAMWNHLLENARSLQNVYFLELHPTTRSGIIVRRVKRLPPIRQTVKGSRPDPSLPLSAIKGMVHLKSVAWRGRRYDMEFSQPGLGSFLEECWNTLSKHCRDLQEVTTGSSAGCCDCALQREGHRIPSTFFNLRRLTSLSYTFYCTHSGHPYNPVPLFDFLAANSELQALRLVGYSPRHLTQDLNLRQLFQLRFPKLRTFSLVADIATIPLCSVNDFLHAHPSLESIYFGRTISIAMSSTSPRSNLLPKLKQVTISSGSDGLVPWFFGELAPGPVRPLASVNVYLPEETNRESDHFLGRMSRLAGERLQALSVCFSILEPSMHWALVMTRISSTCPNLRRLNVKRAWGMLPSVQPVAGNVGNWIAPLHALRKLELFDPPEGFLGHFVVRTGDEDQEIKLNHDAMLQLTHTCPSLRLISSSSDLGHEIYPLVYIHSAGDPAKQVDLARSRHNDEGLIIKVDLLDQGQSADYVWELYSVSSVSAVRDLWKVFLPHFDELRFANEM